MRLYKRTERPIPQTTVDRAIKVWDDPVGNSLSYCDASSKTEAHNDAARILRSFARNVLGLKDDKFSVRSNKGGIAVSGEVTLHTEPLPECNYGIYIQISQSSMGPGMSVLYRACKHRADYTGFRNYWNSMADLFKSEKRISEFHDEIIRICKEESPPQV